MKEDKENLDSVMNFITEDIEKKSSVLFYIGSDGDIILLSTGECTKQQVKVAERMLIAGGDHSFVLKLFLAIEIILTRFEDKISQMFRKTR